jgi:phosphonopyruvate decarboxylase
MIASEVDAHRGGTPAPRDLLVVGSMGHASSIALGIALARPRLHVCCLDGDGAALMHMGSMAANAQLSPPRLIHIVLNNRCHDSVGGQPTAAPAMELHRIATACGYRSGCRLDSLDLIAPVLATCFDRPGPHLIEISVRPGHRSDLGRPREPCRSVPARFLSGLGSA